MNLKLSQVVSDLTGATGMAILKAIIAGERDPLTLATLRNPHCQHSEDEIAKALQGNWRAEHLFAFQHAVELSQFSHQQLTVCDQHMQTQLGTFVDKSQGQPLPPKARRHKKANEPRFDARTRIFTKKPLFYSSLCETYRSAQKVNLPISCLCYDAGHATLHNINNTTIRYPSLWLPVARKQLLLTLHIWAVY